MGGSIYLTAPARRLLVWLVCRRIWAVDEDRVLRLSSSEYGVFCRVVLRCITLLHHRSNLLDVGGCWEARFSRLVWRSRSSLGRRVPCSLVVEQCHSSLWNEILEHCFVVGWYPGPENSISAWHICSSSSMEDLVDPHFVINVLQRGTISSKPRELVGTVSGWVERQARRGEETSSLSSSMLSSSSDPRKFDRGDSGP